MEASILADGMEQLQNKLTLNWKLIAVPVQLSAWFRDCFACGKHFTTTNLNGFIFVKTYDDIIVNDGTQ
jgi:hypothetical protein